MRSHYKLRRVCRSSTSCASFKPIALRLDRLNDRVPRVRRRAGRQPYPCCSDSPFKSPRRSPSPFPASCPSQQGREQKSTVTTVNLFRLPRARTSPYSVFFRGVCAMSLHCTLMRCNIPPVAANAVSSHTGTVITCQLCVGFCSSAVVINKKTYAHGYTQTAAVLHTYLTTASSSPWTAIGPENLPCSTTTLVGLEPT